MNVLCALFAGLSLFAFPTLSLGSTGQDSNIPSESKLESVTENIPLNGSKSLDNKGEWVLSLVCAGQKCEQMLVFDGAINPQAIEGFLGASRKLARGTTLLLNSTSGDLNSGIKLGELIHQNGFNTRIGKIKNVQQNTKLDGQCYSACVLSFSGGLNRYIDANDLVGVNALRLTPGAKEPEYKESMKVLSSYFDQMGVDRRIIDLMLKAKAKGITKISLDTAKQLNLDNAPSNHAHLWRVGAISGTNSPIGLVSEKQASGQYAITLGLTRQNKDFRLTIFIQPIAGSPNFKGLARLLNENPRITLISSNQTLSPGPNKPWELSNNGLISAVSLSEKDLNQLVSALHFDLEFASNEAISNNSFKLDRITSFSTAGLKGVMLTLKK